MYNPLKSVADTVQNAPPQIKAVASGLLGPGAGLAQDVSKYDFSKLDPTKKIPKNDFHADNPTQQPGYFNQDFAKALAGPYAGANFSQAQGIGNQQQALANALQLQSQGKGPAAELAQNQFNQNTQANIAQGAGQLASQKGINPAIAARMISQNAAMANQQGAGQAANLALQGQLGATNQLGGVLGGMETAAQQQAAQQAQLQLEHQNMLQSGALQQNQQLVNAGLGAQGINAGVATGNAANKTAIAGGVISGLSGAGAKAIGGAAHGAIVPGVAKVEGDSPENDTVDIKASPGEIIVPRSAADDPEKAKSFIDHIMKEGGKDKTKGYGGILNAKRELEAIKKKMAALETKIGGAA